MDKVLPLRFPYQFLPLPLLGLSVKVEKSTLQDLEEFFFCNEAVYPNSALAFVTHVCVSFGVDSLTKK